MPANPTDPLYAQQWHFSLIGNIQAIWDEYDGLGVQVGVYDDGLQYNHPDLALNYDASLHFRHQGVTYDPMPIQGTDSHGTACAGLIGAADNNGRGGVGVAHGVRLTGVNFLDDIQNRGDALIDASLRWAVNFDIMSNSWGRRAAYAADQSLARDPSVSGSARFDAIFAGVVANGRGGLGTVIVQAAGNDTLNSNGDGVNASRYTLTIAATERNGMVAEYSNFGVGILIAAPASAVTTDRTGEDGSNGSGDQDFLPIDYTGTFNGTSAATPTVAGVVALMLEANEGLGWRDVKNILAHSAQHTGSAYDAAPSLVEQGGWGSGVGTQWNGGGSVFHLSYGFGMLDAYAAVRMAEVWTILHGPAATSANERVVTSNSTGWPQAIPDASFDFYFNIIEGERRLGFNVTEDVQVETIYVTVDLQHQRGFDLALYLVLPNGDAIPLMLNEDETATPAAAGMRWTFEVEALRGMSSLGNWQLVARDSLLGATGVINSATLQFFGSTASNNDVYTFTQDFLALAALEAGRTELGDMNGGVDWINMAAIAGNITSGLAGGGATVVNGARWFALAANALFENIVTGDGNDSITGNALNNHIMGMRGNDTLLGDAGNDLLNGGTGIDTAVFSGTTRATVNLNLTGAQNTGYGTDRLIGIENILSFAGNDALIGNAVANILNAGAGNDQLNGGGGNDTMLGGAGNDTYVVNATGDRVFETTTTASTINAGGIDTVQSGVSFDLDASAGVRFVERLTLTGTGNINGTGNALANVLTGNAGKNVLNGGIGNDTLNGGRGGDRLYGGLGNDTMLGGAGNDTYVVNATGDRVFETTTTASNINAGGIDTVQSEVSLNLAAYSGVRFVERLTLTGTGNINGTGNALANVLTGNAGNNVLNGGSGNDTMKGGAGNDTFVFSTGLGARNVDRISDFNVAQDTIHLDDSVFTGLANGSLRASAFAANLTGVATDALDRIIYETDTGRVYFDANGNGVGARFHFATLTANLALTNADFLVF